MEFSRFGAVLTDRINCNVVGLHSCPGEALNERPIWPNLPDKCRWTVRAVLVSGLRRCHSQKQMGLMIQLLRGSEAEEASVM